MPVVRDTEHRRLRWPSRVEGGQAAIDPLEMRREGHDFVHHLVEAEERERINGTQNCMNETTCRLQLQSACGPHPTRDAVPLLASHFPVQGSSTLAEKTETGYLGRTASERLLEDQSEPSCRYEMMESFPVSPDTDSDFRHTEQLRQLVGRCADCGTAICAECRFECCSDSFCVSCYDYHGTHACVRKPVQPECSLQSSDRTG